jgi:hypothetical protein
MKWQYKLALAMLVLSQTVFFSLAAYNTDNQLYYPQGNTDATPEQGYSWIWYHPEQWMISLLLVVIGIAFFALGTFSDFEERWKNKNELGI